MQEAAKLFEFQSVKNRHFDNRGEYRRDWTWQELLTEELRSREALQRAGWNPDGRRADINLLRLKVHNVGLLKTAGQGLERCPHCAIDDLHPGWPVLPGQSICSLCRYMMNVMHDNPHFHSLERRDLEELHGIYGTSPIENAASEIRRTQDRLQRAESFLPPDEVNIEEEDDDEHD